MLNYSFGVLIGNYWLLSEFRLIVQVLRWEKIPLDKRAHLMSEKQVSCFINRIGYFILFAVILEIRIFLHFIDAFG